MKRLSFLSSLISVFMVTSLVSASPMSNNNLEKTDISELTSEVKTVGDPAEGWEKISDPNLTKAQLSEKYDDFFKPYSEKVPYISQRTTSQTKYDVFDSSGNKRYSGIDSLFNAISLSNSYGWNVKETDGSNVKVFEKNNSTNTFYCFQSTNYYKTVTSITEAKNWVADYASTHVYDGTGKLRFNSYNAIKGVPDLFTLEPESGGYFYKFSNPWQGFKSSYANIKLKNARLKFPTTEGKKNNAYIYKAAVTSSQTVEFGAMTASNLGGDWVLFCRDQSGFYVNRDIVVSKSNLNGTEYVPTQDFELTLSLTDGAALGTVKNTSGSVYQTYRLPASSISANSKLSFLDAVSFVPDDVGKTGDLRNGAYLKNVYLNGSKTYTGASRTGTPYDFFANSSSVNFSFIYNDDVASYTKSSYDEIINIRYDLGYKQ